MKYYLTFVSFFIIFPLFFCVFFYSKQKRFMVCESKHANVNIKYCTKVIDVKFSGDGYVLITYEE